MGARYASAARRGWPTPGITTGRPVGESLDGRLGDVGGRHPHELGQRLARLGIGDAGRLGEAGLDRPGAQRRDGDAGPAQLGARAPGRRRGRTPWTRRSRPVPGSGWNAAVDAVLRIAPRWRVTMPGTKSVHRSTTASTLVRTMASSAARSARCTGPIVVNPALLTRMSTVRPRASIWPGSSPRESASVRSAAMTSARTLWACDELVGQRLEAVLAARHEGDAVAAPGELAGDLGADARRGAGHDGGGVLFGGGEGHGFRS